jgi:hypothetical protein
MESQRADYDPPMSRARKLVEGALKKLDEASARADAAAVAKLSPAERERYDYWQDFIEDPAAWEEQRKLERAARDEIRAQYLAPGRSPVRITCVAARGKTQLREVADYLGSSGLAARPDLVYGAYRVPDLISPGSLGGEGRGVVEWDVVRGAPVRRRARLAGGRARRPVAPLRRLGRARPRRPGAHAVAGRDARARDVSAERVRHHRPACR